MRGTHQMWILQLVEYLYILQLYIKVLVNAFEGSTNHDVIFELNSNFVVDEGLEEAVEEY
jgi:hypothetical protein